MSWEFEVAADQWPAAGQRIWLRPAGYCIVLFNLDGTFYALDDSCPHQGASLGGGELHDGAVQCPAHGLRFDLATGCLRQSPAVRATSYAVKLEHGRLLVMLPAPESA